MARAILDWSRERFSRVAFGKGGVEGTVALSLDVAGSVYRPIYLGTSGTVEVTFLQLSSQPPFDQDSKRLELLRKLNEISGVDLPESAVTRRPRIPLATFAPPEALAKLFEVIEWFLAEARTTEP